MLVEENNYTTVQITEQEFLEAFKLKGRIHTITDDMMFGEDGKVTKSIRIILDRSGVKL